MGEGELSIQPGQLNTEKQTPQNKQENSAGSRWNRFKKFIPHHRESKELTEAKRQRSVIDQKKIAEVQGKIDQLIQAQNVELSGSSNEAALARQRVISEAAKLKSQQIDVVGQPMDALRDQLMKQRTNFLNNGQKK